MLGILNLLVSFQILEAELQDKDKKLKVLCVSCIEIIFISQRNRKHLVTTKKM